MAPDGRNGKGLAPVTLGGALGGYSWWCNDVTNFHSSVTKGLQGVAKQAKRFWSFITQLIHSFIKKDSDFLKFPFLIGTCITADSASINQ